ncbi:hypothetical protein [Flammeovirga aprica]|uniref:Uncharacterized protein n=1 Tax=Flammeovirga aprica JL-4 TaxID=694437 RepID=A0A7X9S0Q6_9BACT|nr:hypothetical protein [Flammeovirga aprica]NME72114.1 hypothetical protein [Flammeovirga aprica JL-4]
MLVKVKIPIICKNFIVLLLLIFQTSCSKKELDYDIKLLENKNWYLCTTLEQDEDQFYDYIKGGILKVTMNYDSIKKVKFLNAGTQKILENVNEHQQGDNNIPCVNKSRIISLTEDSLILVMETPLTISLYGSSIPISIDTMRFTSNFKNVDYEYTQNYTPKFEYITLDYHSPKMRVEIKSGSQFNLIRNKRKYSGSLSKNQTAILNDKILISCFISNIDRIYYQTHFRSFEDCYSSNIDFSIKLKENIKGFKLHDYTLNHVKLKNNELSVEVQAISMDYNFIELSEYIKELSNEVVLTEIQ